MEKLNLERNKEDFYILEVNEKGETIEFDLTDIALPEKIMKASENIGELDKEYQKEMINLQKENIDDVEKTKKAIKIESEKCKQMRKEFDSFLGKNACQKIFGETNYYGMFLQLFDALEPHFNKMKIKLDKAKLKLANKYLPKNKDVM